jgi:hypothetical protein
MDFQEELQAFFLKSGFSFIEEPFIVKTELKNKVLEVENIIRQKKKQRVLKNNKKSK